MTKFFIFIKTIIMSLLNQNKKDKKNKKTTPGGGNSKFIKKPKSSTGFVSKQQNTGSQRGS